MSLQVEPCLSNPNIYWMRHDREGDFMPTESKTLTEQRIRKERALPSMRELQLTEAEGKLLRADQVEAIWAGAVIKLRNAVLAIPSRCASQFADPRHAEQVIRRECELALKQIARKAWHI